MSSSTTKPPPLWRRARFQWLIGTIAMPILFYTLDYATATPKQVSSNDLLASVNDRLLVYDQMNSNQTQLIGLLDKQLVLMQSELESMGLKLFTLSGRDNRRMTKNSSVNKNNFDSLRNDVKAMMNELKIKVAPKLEDQIEISNTSSYAGRKYYVSGSRMWSWSIHLVADSSVINQIKQVTYVLPNTYEFQKPVITSKGDYKEAFAYSAKAYKEHPVEVHILLKDNTKLHLTHNLDL